jgi:hypothetical protein
MISAAYAASGMIVINTQAKGKDNKIVSTQ